MPHAAVLVIASEPVIATLLGLLVELEGFTPVYPEPGERPEDAVARLLAPLIILLDGELEAARSDLFFARAERARAHVVLVAPPFATDDVQRLARARGIPCLSLPTDRAAVGELLRDVKRRVGEGLPSQAPPSSRSPA